MPKLSVIIPTFNSEGTFLRCLNSIRVQTFTDYEIIVQDGGSSDSTIKLVQRFGQDNPGINVKLKQEPDRGVYDAMNKAILRATGEWFYFLGSDDEIYDAHALETVLRDPKAAYCDLLYGDVQLVWTKGPTTERLNFDGPFDLSKLLTKNLCHQSILYRSAFFREVGSYNREYAVYADWDFNMRCWAKGQCAYVDVIVAKFYFGGISTSGQQDPRFDADVTANAIRYFNLSSNDPLINRPDFYGNSAIRRAQEARMAARITPKRVLRALARRLGIAGDN